MFRKPPYDVSMLKECITCAKFRNSSRNDNYPSLCSKWNEYEIYSKTCFFSTLESSFESRYQKDSNFTQDLCGLFQKKEIERNSPWCAAPNSWKSMRNDIHQPLRGRTFEIFDKIHEVDILRLEIKCMKHARNFQSWMMYPNRVAWFWSR